MGNSLGTLLFYGTIVVVGIFLLTYFLGKAAIDSTTQFTQTVGNVATSTTGQRLAEIGGAALLL